MTTPLLLLLVAAGWAGPAKTAASAFLKGQLLERAGSYAEALTAYEEALEADPASSYVSREAAQLALELGQQDKALSLAKKAAALDPRSAESRVLLGRIQAALGEAAAAEAALHEALKLDPKSADAAFSLAGLAASRNPDEARKLLDDFIARAPERASEAHFQRARLELQLGRVAAGRKHLKKAIELDVENEALPARFALAETYESERSTDAALAEYRGILKLEPQNVAVLTRIAQLQLAKDDWEGMRETLLEAKAAQNDDPQTNHGLAAYAERAGDWAKAAQYVRESAAFEDDASLSLRLGYYLTQQGRLEEAVTVLEAARAKWPDNEQVAYFLALGYDDLKRHDAAIALLKQVVRLRPEFRDARFQLGVIYEKTGRLAEAEEVFRRELAERPDDAAVLNYLGYSLADRGLKLEEAEGHIKKAVALDPRNGAYLDSLGWVHYKMGRYAQAVEELERAVRALPDDETVAEHLGDAYAAAGDRAAAWRLHKRAKPQKARALERAFSAERLGALYLEHVRGLQGGLTKVGGLCELTGRLLGRDISYRCLINFKAPDAFELELLGPLFTPVFALRLGPGDFSMDDLAIEGLDPAAVREAARAAAGLMRDYLSGAVFQAEAARLRTAFWSRRRRLETARWCLGLDKALVHVEKVVLAAQPAYRLLLEDFGRTEGRDVPRRMTVEGRGFSLSVRFDNVKLEFAKQ